MVAGLNTNIAYNPGFGNNNAGIYKGIQGTVVSNAESVNNMARYVLGTPAVEEPSLGSSLAGTIPFMGIFGTIQAFPWLKKNYKNPLNAIKDAKLNYEITNPDSRYNFGENTLKVLKEQKQRLFNGISEAEKIKLQENRSFLGKGLDLIPGYKKLRASGFGQMMGKSGAGWMLVFDGAIKTFTEVVPTFEKLGSAAGFRQVGKSAATVASGAAGWTGGEIVGSAVGAAIGTAICPGVGTAIGKFVGGFLGGTVGLHFATKATKSIVGESELEKSMNEIQENAMNNKDAQILLAQQASAKADAALQMYPEDEQAKLIKEQADAILAESSLADNNNITNTQNIDAEQIKAAETQSSPLNFGMLSGIQIPTVPGFDGVNYDLNVYNQAMKNAAMFNPKMYSNK